MAKCNPTFGRPQIPFWPFWISWHVLYVNDLKILALLSLLLSRSLPMMMRMRMHQIKLYRYTQAQHWTEYLFIFVNGTRRRRRSSSSINLIFELFINCFAADVKMQAAAASVGVWVDANWNDELIGMCRSWFLMRHAESRALNIGSQRETLHWSYIRTAGQETRIVAAAAVENELTRDDLHKPFHGWKKLRLLLLLSIPSWLRLILFSSSVLCQDLSLWVFLLKPSARLVDSSLLLWQPFAFARRFVPSILADCWLCFFPACLPAFLYSLHPPPVFSANYKTADALTNCSNVI